MVLIESECTMAILIIVLSILIFTDTKIRLKDLFMLGGLAVLTLMTRRQLSMLTLIGGYSVNILICDLFDKYDPDGTKKFMNDMTSVFGIIITILLIILISIMMYRPQIGDKYINNNSYPVEAANWIKENLNLEEIRLFNEYNYGSYLLYEGIPVFIDSRADLYTPQFNGDSDKDIFTDYVKASGIGAYYDDILKKYDITHVILVKNSKLNMFISRDENYKQLYQDDHFVIYERLTK